MGLFGDIKGTRQNTFEIGNGQAGDKTLVARNGDANPPKVRYNDTTNLWQYSNDGTMWNDFTPLNHDHNGGDGAQIDHVNLANKGTNTHATIDAHLASTSNPHSTTADQVLPSQTGNSGKFLTTNGTTASWGTPDSSGGGVSWETSVRSSSFTAIAGEGYLLDTSGGTFNMTLPLSPSVGDLVAGRDIANSFDTNNLSLLRNGEKIEALSEDLTDNVEGDYFYLLYTGATYGWRFV
ncbi:MAG: hypothetical protein K8I29_19430 [Alphaproteobacteria bacterium]|uniref:Uncharacterized protein n=1 Tax=Candidatus Nitrobium versatile TaxID=2884831 RepID=A0A953M3M6_9BACT|nr:hypothetical protein [Candidatus Nitrobium versatile]